MEEIESPLTLQRMPSGQMRKANKTTAKDFTAIENLALSWTAATEKKNVRPNEIVAVDWGILNKTSNQYQERTMSLHSI
jgi:hypothetical protein